jgi:hypothetical protein
MARKQNQEENEVTPEKKSNIEQLDALRKEFATGKMVERKLVALRVKLVSLFTEKIITPDEQDLMETILRKDRNRGNINSAYSYLLNAIESERCVDVAFVKVDDAPMVHHLKKHLECKYVYDAEYNDGKNKEDSLGRYYVYVPRTIPTEYQLSAKTVMKELKGHPTDPSDYPPEKVLIHRISLKEREFQKWFEIEDENILNAEKAEPVYTF